MKTMTAIAIVLGALSYAAPAWAAKDDYRVGFTCSFEAGRNAVEYTFAPSMSKDEDDGKFYGRFRLTSFKLDGRVTSMSNNSAAPQDWWKFKHNNAGKTDGMTLTPEDTSDEFTIEALEDVYRDDDGRTVHNAVLKQRGKTAGSGTCSHGGSPQSVTREVDAPRPTRNANSLNDGGGDLGDREARARHGGIVCFYPGDTDRAGKRCGDRSATQRPWGY